MPFRDGTIGAYWCLWSRRETTNFDSVAVFFAVMRGVNAKVSVPVDFSEPALLTISIVEWRITEFRSIQRELKFSFPSYKQARRSVILWLLLPPLLFSLFFFKPLLNISRINDRTFFLMNLKPCMATKRFILS